MVIVRCSVPGCQFQSDDVIEALAVALLTNHGLAHTATAAPPTLRGPKLERPKVDVGVTLEEWNVFVRRWNVFRNGSGIDDDSAPSQLFQCAWACPRRQPTEDGRRSCHKTATRPPRRHAFPGCDPRRYGRATNRPTAHAPGA